MANPVATPLGVTAWAAIVIVLACASPAVGAKRSAAEAVAAGREIAINVCSTCHVVADKQPFDPLLMQKTPSFQTVAADPKTSARSLRRFITSTHWDEKTIPMTMPRQLLSGSETDDVISYILSLRAPR